MSDDIDELSARLKSLKVPPSKDDYRGRLDALKGPKVEALPEEQVKARFAKLTGTDLSDKSTATNKTTKKTEAEEIEDLLDQLASEAAIDDNNGGDDVLKEYLKPVQKSKVKKEAKFDDEVSELMNQIQEKVRKKKETGLESDPEVLDSDGEEPPFKAGDIIRQAVIDAAIAKKYGEKDEPESPDQLESPEQKQKKKAKKKNQRRRRKNDSSEEGEDDDESEHSSEHEPEDHTMSRHQKAVNEARRKADKLSALIKNKKK